MVAITLLLLGAVPVVLHGPTFYFGDNVQDLFLPVFIEMGRQLTHGQFPFVTLGAWFGGSFVGEYAFGVFHPVVLALASVFYLLFDSLSEAASFFAVFHLALFGLGVFATCGALGCRFAAALFVAITAATEIWMIYWAAMSWSCTEASIAWLAWAVWAILRLRSDPRWLLPAAAIIALTFACGAPHTNVALIVFIAILLLWTFAKKGLASCSSLLLAAIGGTMLAAPSVLPLFPHYYYSMRPLTFDFAQWSVPVYAFTSIGMPLFFAPWPTWLQWDVYAFPLVYIDIAIPFILLKVRRDHRALFDDEYVRLFGWLTLVFLALCTIPNVSTLRWSFRFLPMFHLFLLLLTARILAVARSRDVPVLQWDRRLAAIALIPPLAISALTILIRHLDWSGPFGLRQSATIALFTAMAAAVLAYSNKWPWDRRLYAGAAAHCLVYFGIVAAYPVNPSTPRYNVLDSRQAAHAEVFGPGNTLFLYDWPVRSDGRSGWRNLHPEDRSTWLFPGATPLSFGGRAINGTSGVKPAAVEQFFEFGDDGELISDPLPRLFSRNTATGSLFVDLMHVETIVAEAGKWTDAATQTIPASWSRQSVGEGGGMIFRNPDFHPSAGTLSFLPKGVTAELLSFSDRRERYRIAVSPGYTGQPVVFARAWYPGYQVSLNGATADYGLAGDILPEIVLPANFAGTLDIVYVPAGFRAGCLLAALGGMALVVASWGHFRRKQTQPAAAL